MVRARVSLWIAIGLRFRVRVGGVSVRVVVTYSVLG